MIKAYDTSASGTPLLVFGITPEDAALLTGGKSITTSIRSRSGIEAVLMVTGGPSNEAMHQKMTELGIAVIESVPASELVDAGNVRVR